MLIQKHFRILGNLVKEVLQMYQFKLADNLCKFCSERKISVNELADAIGKSPRQVNRYRNGQCENISLCTLAKIASVLNISIADLLR